jgi:pimeloyl-ACP methyl ester carboxylesterase
VKGITGVTISTFVAAAVAVIYGFYDRDIERARRRISTGEIVSTACGPIEYGVAGDGPPVLFVHGAGGGYDQGLSFGQALAEAGFKVIAMSRFGYLRTPLPDDASEGAQADAHACLLDALGIARTAVVGGSAGAPSSLQFALRHPHRTDALVLLVPAAYTPRAEGEPAMPAPRGTRLAFETALESDFLFWAAIRIAPRLLIGAILATPPELVEHASGDERARVDSILEQILPVSVRRLGLLNDAAITSTLSRYELERIATPTLVLSVEDDLFGTYAAGRYTADHIPGARFVGYPTGGHVWVGHQREIAAEIVAFLRR